MIRDKVFKFLLTVLFLSLEILAQFGQLFKILKKQIIKIFDNNFIISSIFHHILLRIFNNFNQSIIIIFILLQIALLMISQAKSIVFKQLKKKSSVKAITVSSEPSNMLIASSSLLFVLNQHCKAGLKFSVNVFVLDNRRL